MKKVLGIFIAIFILSLIASFIFYTLALVVSIVATAIKIAFFGAIVYGAYLLFKKLSKAS